MPDASARPRKQYEYESSSQPASPKKDRAASAAAAIGLGMTNGANGNSIGGWQEVRDSDGNDGLRGGHLPNGDSAAHAYMPSGPSGKRASEPAAYTPFRSGSIALPASISSSLSAASASSLFPSAKFIALCMLWYMTSAISSNTGKSIFNQFRFPVTLTLVQFLFTTFYCAIWTSPYLGMATLRQPSYALFRGVVPMAAFQVGGHIFSSLAISRVPVSTVHTIKALSPLFTVAAYALLFGVRYSNATYISLLPLTLGVMFACSFDISGSNYVGFLAAFASTLVFVSSNIFFKKMVPASSGASQGAGSSTSPKLDKINLLFYTSLLAFTFMIPLWFYSDLGPIINDIYARKARNAPSRTRSVLTSFFLNGLSHFLQNILAFNILASTSPVTYSIASLIKRIVVICLAIIWFRQPVHPVQGFGITLTFFGLFLYQNAKQEVERVEKKVRQIDSIRDGSFLPSTKEDEKLMETSREGRRSIGGRSEALYAGSSNAYMPQPLPPPPHNNNNLSHPHHHNSHPPHRGDVLYAPQIKSIHA